MAEDIRPTRTETDAGEEGTGLRRLGRIYAEALLAAADKRGDAEAVGDEVIALVDDVFRVDPRIEELLKSPAVRRAEKEPLIRQAFGGKVSDLVLNFLLVLNEKERLALLRPVANALRDLLDERAKRVRVRVRTAVDLDEDQRQTLQETLRKQLTLEPVLDVRVEPELLGGMIVRVGDTVFDSSVRTRIETLRNQLLARSSYEIQSGRDRFRSDA